MTSELDPQPPSSTVEIGSPHFPPFPLSRLIKRTGNDNISAAERKVLDAAKARLILPKNRRPSPHERAKMAKDAFDRKKAALLLLASAQRDLETHSSFLIEEQGLEETTRFYDAHYDIGDDDTAVGRFMKVISSITLN